MTKLRLAGRVVGVLLLTAPAPALVACGSSGRTDGHEWQAVHDTIGDTVVVRTVSGSVWRDTAKLVAEVTIGEFEGPDEYMFGRVRSLAVAPDGSIYVFDSHANALRKYAPDGTYIATFGREGGGPGEYERPDGGLAVLPDGRVLLRDPANNRINVYSGEGEHLDSWRVRGGFFTSRRLYTDMSGNSYTMLILDPTADLDEWRYGLLLFDPDGVPADTLPAPTWDFAPSELVSTSGEGDNQSVSMEYVPFTPTVTWTHSPLGYMLGGVSTRYALELFTAPGRVLRIERADWEPVRVLPAEKEEQERIITADMRQVDPGWRWNSDPVPATKPPYKGIDVGERGRIWVWLHTEARKIETEEAEEVRPGQLPPQTWLEPVVFDVFDPDGRYLGNVRAPEGFSRYPIPVIHGDTVWAVVRGEFDVPSVVRFRVEHGSADDT